MENHEIASPDDDGPALPHVMAALSSPERQLGPQTVLTTVAGRIARAGAYESYLAGRASDRTVSTMRDGLDRVSKLVGGRADSIPWHRMRFSETEAIRGELMRSGYSVPTVRVTMAALRGVLTHAKRLGLMSSGDFASATDWPRIGGHALPAGRDLSDDEIERLGAYCRARGPDAIDWPASAYGAFLSALFALLIGAGPRATELSRATVEAYDVEAGLLRLLRKGRKEHQIPISPDVAAPLAVWLAVRSELEPPTRALLVRVQPNGTVRPKSANLNVRALEYLCTTIGEAIGIPRFSPHDCRRTFATRGLDQGIDLSTMQRLMGHASSATTVRYDKRGLKKDAEARGKLKLWPGIT
jgi:integrase